MITRAQYVASLYPFDPSLNASDFDGLHKLRCFADRDLAGYLAAIWGSISSVRMKEKR